MAAPGPDKVDTIDALSAENRKFPPTESFKEDALVTGTFLYDEAAEDDVAFWARQAADLVDWATPWDTTLEWDLPNSKWFIGGELNVAHNCLDRHVLAGNGDRVAIHWEGEPGDTRTITYADLLAEVSQFANVLKGLGVERGDRVNIYLPMIPEAAVAMLACARIGAAHSVVFGGFSAQSLADRINDAEAKVLITADGGYRRGSVFPLKTAADEACADTPSIEHVVVVKRGGNDVEWVDGRDHWYHDLMDGASTDCPAEPMDAEQLLFLLYTSGTTGRPKGIMHTTGGYLTHVAYTHKYVFDLHPETDVFWCTADVGWITGHSYIVYGPLANGATQVMYEGVPEPPGQRPLLGDRREVRRDDPLHRTDGDPHVHEVGQRGTRQARSVVASPPRIRRRTDQPRSLDVVPGTHRRRANPDRRHLVADRDRRDHDQPTSGRHDDEARLGHVPAPRRVRRAHRRRRNRVDVGGGYLTLTRPWPGMLRGIWGDPERFQETYWSRFEGRYFAGDGAKLDDEGYLWLLGRVDDVMNVSGHRISTTEVESALVSHPAVAEAAVVGATDATTGQAIIAYVILRGGEDVDAEVLRSHVAAEIGAIAKPKRIYLTPDLPKTRSGKIMRRLLRDVAEGRNIGDTTTLADASIVDELQARAAETADD